MELKNKVSMQPTPAEASTRNDDKRANPILADLAATGGIAVVYFAYLLWCAWRPQAFARPVTPDTLVPWGLVGGIAVVVMVMAAAAFYMVARNRDTVPTADDQ